MEFPIGRFRESWINGVIASAIIAVLGAGVYMLCAVMAGAFAWGAAKLHPGGYGAGATIGWVVSLVALVPLALGEAVRLTTKARGWVSATIPLTR